MLEIRACGLTAFFMFRFAASASRVFFVRGRSEGSGLMDKGFDFFSIHVCVLELMP